MIQFRKSEAVGKYFWHLRKHHCIQSTFEKNINICICELYTIKNYETQTRLLVCFTSRKGFLTCYCCKRIDIDLKLYAWHMYLNVCMSLLLSIVNWYVFLAGGLPLRNNHAMLFYVMYIHMICEKRNKNRGSPFT